VSFNPLHRLLAKLGLSREVNISALQLSQPVSWTDKYREVVPPPEPVQSPRLIAAKWMLGDLYAEQMPGIAADLLEAGYDTPSLRRLAGETQIACSADVEDLVAKMCREIGMDYPLPKQLAQFILSRQIAREVLADKRDPSSAGADLRSIWNWKSTPNENIAALLSWCDETPWDAENQRFGLVLNEEFFKLLARVAKMPDSEIGLQSSP
jgi:hypothetical protein